MATLTAHNTFMLRALADRIETGKDKEERVSFPGWHDICHRDRERGVRAAAKAILADMNCGSSYFCQQKDIGRLIRYIADMLGED